MSEPEPVNEDAVVAAVRAAVEGALAGQGQYPTKWVLVAETLGNDSERSLWFTTAEGAKPWDIIGMVGFLDAMERNAAGPRRGGD